MFSYLKDWGISWEKLKKEDFRKERDYVPAKRKSILMFLKRHVVIIMDVLALRGIS